MRRLGFPVIHTREPGGTELGESIRKLLLDPAHRNVCPKTEFLLYEAVRAQHTTEKIRKNLRLGKVVVCERYSDASMAYQGFGRGLPQRSLETIDKFATDGLTPDLTILFDLPVEVGLRKAISAKKEFSKKGDRMERAGLAFHRKVRQGYLALAKRHSRIRVVAVRPGSTPDSTFEKVRNILGIIVRKAPCKGRPNAARRTKR